MDTPHDQAAARRLPAPLPGRHFLVDLGDIDPRDPAAGFSEVIFPPFQADRAASASPPPGSATAADAGDAYLVLKRAATGAMDLYGWWNETRRARTPKGRTVTVQWLAADRQTAVMTWRFLGAYPVRLSYSPLQSMRDELVIESIALAFERVEMS